MKKKKKKNTLNRKNIPRAQLPGASQRPVLKMGISWECAGLEQPRPAELILSCIRGELMILFMEIDSSYHSKYICFQFCLLIAHSICKHLYDAHIIYEQRQFCLFYSGKYQNIFCFLLFMHLLEFPEQ